MERVWSAYGSGMGLMLGLAWLTHRAVGVLRIGETPAANGGIEPRFTDTARSTNVCSTVEACRTFNPKTSFCHKHPSGIFREFI